MANAVTTQILLDGHRNVVLKLTGVLDTSNEALTTKISVTDVTPQPTLFRIDHIDFSISDQMEVQLLWKGTPDLIILPLAGRGKFSYDKIGGLQNNATTPTGAIALQTTGWASGTQIYSVVLDLVKQGVSAF